MKDLYDSFDECLSLAPEELKDLVELLVSVGCIQGHAKRGTALGLQGDTANWLFLILSGQVKVMICDSDGQEKAISILHDKAVLLGESGFFSKKSYNASMFAKTDVDYIPITRRELEAAIAIRPQLAWKIINSMGKKIYHLTCEVAELSFYDINTRLAEKLLNLAAENGEIHNSGEIFIKIRLTDEELAALLGTSREVITRHMSRFQKLGILRRENRQIVISDIAALRLAGAKEKQSLD